MIWTLRVDHHHFVGAARFTNILLILLCGNAVDRQWAFELHISPKYGSTETSYQRLYGAFLKDLSFIGRGDGSGLSCSNLVDDDVSRLGSWLGLPGEFLNLRTSCVTDILSRYNT